MATSDDSGRYLLEGHYPHSEGTVTVSANGYRTTNTPIQLSGQPITHAASIASIADIRRQLTTLLLVEKPAANSIVVVDLVDSAGDPVEGVPASDLTLMIPGRLPDGFGPVFFGPDGDLRSQAELPSSTVFDGRARAAFCNVGNGTRFVQVNTSLGAASCRASRRWNRGKTSRSLSRGPADDLTSRTHHRSSEEVRRSGGDVP